MKAVKSTTWRTLLLLCPLLGICLFLLERHVRSAGAVAQDPPKQDFTFEKVVQPFFANNCYACHDEAHHTADLNLEAFKSAASLNGDRGTMKVILNKLRAGEMPPPKMPRPKPEDIAAVTDWLARQIAVPSEKTAARPAEPDAGPVTVRRLNRVEYNNTVRDLLGIDLHPSDNFPQDDSGYGFDNISDVLSLSPVLMEKYLAAAEKISRTAVFGVEPTKPTLVQLRSGQRSQVPQWTPLTDYDLSGLSLPNAVHTTYRFPVDGEYVIRVNLGGVRPPGSEALKLALWIDGKQTQELQVDPAAIASFADAAEPQELWGVKREFKLRMTSGDHWLAVAIPHLYEGLPLSYKGPNPSQRPVLPRKPFKLAPNLSPKENEERLKEFEKKRAEKIPANGARVSSLELGGP